jgi:hypothetical protein
MPKNIIDPRLLRLRKLYQELDGMPDRLKEYRKVHKERIATLKADIEKAWEAIEGTGKEQTPLTFPVHHGDTLVGFAHQPKTGTGK